MSRHSLLALCLPVVIAIAGCTSAPPAGSVANTASQSESREIDYRLRDFSVTLEMPEGWVEAVRYDNAVFLDGPNRASLAFGHVEAIIPSPPPDDPSQVESLDEPTVDRVLELIRDNRDVEMTEPEAAEIGGLSGQRVDLTSEERIPLIGTSRGAAGTEGETGVGLEGIGVDRTVFLQAQDPQQVVFVDVFTDNADAIEDAWAEAQPVLEGMTFE